LSVTDPSKGDPPLRLGLGRPPWIGAHMLWPSAMWASPLRILLHARSMPDLLSNSLAIFGGTIVPANSPSMMRRVTAATSFMTQCELPLSVRGQSARKAPCRSCQPAVLCGHMLPTPAESLGAMYKIALRNPNFVALLAFGLSTGPRSGLDLKVAFVRAFRGIGHRGCFEAAVWPSRPQAVPWRAPGALLRYLNASRRYLRTTIVGAENSASHRLLVRRSGESFTSLPGARNARSKKDI
jgi:hypothetical protein